MQDQLPAAHDGRQALQKASAILVVAVDRLASVPACRHVVDGARKLYPEWPRHANGIIHSAHLPTSMADPVTPVTLPSQYWPPSTPGTEPVLRQWLAVTEDGTEDDPNVVRP